MNLDCYIDGVYVDGFHLDQDELCAKERKRCVFDSRKTSGMERRLFRFTAPVSYLLVLISRFRFEPTCRFLQILTEDATPGIDVSNVAIISAKFQRSTSGRVKSVCEPKRKKSTAPQEEDAADSDLLAGQINEVQKSHTLIGAVTGLVSHSQSKHLLIGNCFPGMAIESPFSRPNLPQSCPGTSCILKTKRSRSTR
jgi:hypothetical protein